MIPLDEVMREQLFTASTPLTDALALLYQQWTRSFLRVTPTLSMQSLWRTRSSQSFARPRRCTSKSTRMGSHVKRLAPPMFRRAYSPTLKVPAVLYAASLEPAFSRNKTMPSLARRGSSTVTPIIAGKAAPTASRLNFSSLTGLGKKN